MDNEKPFESGIETSSACKSPDEAGTATSSPKAYSRKRSNKLSKPTAV
jgi:hypothetical protein